MIVDNLKNIDQYAGLSKNFSAAIDYLKSTELDKLAPGRIDIDGKNVFAIVSEKELTGKPDAWEVHNRYADIHLIIRGNETIGYFPRIKLEYPIDFGEGSDSAALKNIDGVYHTLSGGDFMILLPQDVHVPNCPYGERSISKKIMVKVLTEQ